MERYAGPNLKLPRDSDPPGSNAQSEKMPTDVSSSGWGRLTDAATIATLTLLASLALAAWRMRPKQLTKEFDDALNAWVDETNYPAG